MFKMWQQQAFTDRKCLAKDKRCFKCNLIGHFREYCKTRQKRIFDNKIGTKPKKYKQDSIKTEKVDYIFHLDEYSLINCSIGGVKIEMLIDSGSKCNVITDKVVFKAVFKGAQSKSLSSNKKIR